MTTPHARHLAEMRATLPRQPVDDIPVVVSHLRDLVPCATRRHLLEMRVLAALADGEWHRDEEVGAIELNVLSALVSDGVVIHAPNVGWRLAPGERCANCTTQRADREGDPVIAIPHGLAAEVLRALQDGPLVTGHVADAIDKALDLRGDERVDLVSTWQALIDLRDHGMVARNIAYAWELRR